jgi:hypothetical protein
MRASGSFAYAQARLQARFSGLPGESDWQQLAGLRGLAAFLEEARAGALGGWVKPFSAQSDSHDIEIGLRIAYREQVTEVAAWVPARWRDAVSWTRWLVLMPLFDHMARDMPAPDWLRRDHDLQALLDETAGVDRARLQRAGAGVLLVPGGDPVASWLAEWRRRWPDCGAACRRGLAALEALLSRHLAAFRRSDPELAWELRRRLRAQLGLLFHRRLLEPVTGFIFLGVVALDLERLRSELVARALFAGGEEP